MPNLFDKVFGKPSPTSDTPIEGDVFSTFFGGPKPFKSGIQSKLPEDVQQMLEQDYELYRKLWSRYAKFVRGNWSMSRIPTLKGFEDWLLKRLKEEGRL